jgi:hypothetical protein
VSVSAQVEVAPFGVGRVASARSSASEGIVEVRLPWGRLFTQRSSVSRGGGVGGGGSSTSAPPPAPSLSASELAARAASLVSPSSVPLVSSICLSAAALKAKELSLDEERKVLRCVAQLLQAQMRRVELKLNHLQQLSHYTMQKQQDTHQHYIRQYQQALHNHSNTVQAPVTAEASTADATSDSTTAAAMQTDSVKAVDTAPAPSANGGSVSSIKAQA